MANPTVASMTEDVKSLVSSPRSSLCGTDTTSLCEVPHLLSIPDFDDDNVVVGVWSGSTPGVDLSPALGYPIGGGGGGGGGELGRYTFGRANVAAATPSPSWELPDHPHRPPGGLPASADQFEVMLRQSGGDYGGGADDDVNASAIFYEMTDGSQPDSGNSTDGAALVTPLADSDGWRDGDAQPVFRDDGRSYRTASERRGNWLSRLGRGGGNLEDILKDADTPVMMTLDLDDDVDLSDQPSSLRPSDSGTRIFTARSIAASQLLSHSRPVTPPSPSRQRHLRHSSGSSGWSSESFRGILRNGRGKKAGSGSGGSGIFSVGSGDVSVLSSRSSGSLARRGFRGILRNGRTNRRDGGNGDGGGGRERICAGDGDGEGSGEGGGWGPRPTTGSSTPKGSTAAGHPRATAIVPPPSRRETLRIAALSASARGQRLEFADGGTIRFGRTSPALTRGPRREGRAVTGVDADTASGPLLR